MYGICFGYKQQERVGCYAHTSNSIRCYYNMGMYVTSLITHQPKQVIKIKDMSQVRYNGRSEYAGQIVELTDTKQRNFTMCIVNVEGKRKHILVKDVLENQVGTWVKVNVAGRFCVATSIPYGPVLSQKETIRRIMTKF